MNGGPKKEKSKTRKAKDQTEYIPQQVNDCLIFELAIRAFGIQIGWRNSFESHHKYMARDISMVKLNPEK
jgi:hypothetical protein